MQTLSDGLNPDCHSYPVYFPLLVLARYQQLRHRPTQLGDTRETYALAFQGQH